MRMPRAQGNPRDLRDQVRDFESRLHRLEQVVAPVPDQEEEPVPSEKPLVEQDSGGPQLGGRFTLETIEREHIERVIARSSSLRVASRILGIDQSTLYRKRMRYLDKDLRAQEARSVQTAVRGSGRKESGS